MTAADGDEKPTSAWELLANALFEVGGEDQMAGLRSKYIQEPSEPEDKKRLEEKWLDFASNVQIRIGTLLKTDTISFLLGAGASKECGGVLIGKVPLEAERSLLEDGASRRRSGRIQSWLLQFYVAVARLSGDPQAVPTSRQEIAERYTAVMGDRPPDELPVNLESVLSLLWRWRATLPQVGGRIRLDGIPSIDVRSADIDECLRRTTSALVDQCRLPMKTAAPQGFRAYEDLLRKVLARPLNLKRVNLFTLNYDTLVEQAADAEGVVLVDGFIGTIRRVFRPESYDQDFYFPAETTEGRVHRLDRVAHLYKLHGSLTWRAEEPEWDNPYGVVAGAAGPTDERRLLIYPTPGKIGDTLGMPYAELFRRFAAAVVRSQSTLFVLGYGFGDEHVNAIIRQALTVPSFTVVIVDPTPKSEFVRRLKARRDRRVWILSGTTLGTFSGFAEHVLPELRDEEVRRKVIATYRALRPDAAKADTKEDGDA
jgi:hypothetical protein